MKSPVYSKHDSLIVLDEYVRELKVMMLEDLCEGIGLPPKLKEEKLSPESIT